MTTETVLTDEQIEQGRHDTFSTGNPFCPCDSKTMRKAARWAEQAVLQSPEIQTLRDAAVLNTVKRAEYFGKGHSAGWKSALGAAIDKVAIHGGSVEIEAAIRALIPKQ